LGSSAPISGAVAHHAELPPLMMSEAIAVQAGGAPRWAAFIDRAFVPICPIDRFIGISTCILAR
jgi:hypothetical protein